MSKRKPARASKARFERTGADVQRKILILGASYGSLFGTKLLMAGHAVTLVCTEATAGFSRRRRDRPADRGVGSSASKYRALRGGGVSAARRF